jgi:hypothetical protein
VSQSQKENQEDQDNFGLLLQQGETLPTFSDTTMDHLNSYHFTSFQKSIVIYTDGDLPELLLSFVADSWKNSQCLKKTFTSLSNKSSGGCFLITSALQSESSLDSLLNTRNKNFWSFVSNSKPQKTALKTIMAGSAKQIQDIATRSRKGKMPSPTYLLATSGIRTTTKQ